MLRGVAQTRLRTKDDAVAELDVANLNRLEKGGRR